MELENRYIVIKRSDLQALLDSGEIDSFMVDELNLILETISNYRSDAGKLPLETVVIESDWPIYEEAKELLEEISDLEAQEEYTDGWEAARQHSDKYSSHPLVRGISRWCRGWNDYMAFQINKK